MLLSEIVFSELLALFISSLVSATLFPGGSELLLVYYVKNNPDNSLYYFFAATAGNSIGALISYIMGYYLTWGRDKVKAKHARAWNITQRYGVWSLLLSWMPIIGDAFPLIAGWLKLSLWQSILFIVIGKGLRYALVITSVLSLL